MNPHTSGLLVVITNGPESPVIVNCNTCMYASMQLHEPRRIREPANKLLGRLTIFEGLIGLFYCFPLSLPDLPNRGAPVPPVRRIGISGLVLGQA